MKTIFITLITWFFGLFGINITPNQHDGVVIDTPDKTASESVIHDKDYAKLICGYWEPVEGTKSKLDISKYGTITRHYKLYNSWYEDREEYVISGNELTIRPCYECTVDVVEENGVTYLEVYGHENYAGKYKKKSPTPNKTTSAPQKQKIVAETKKEIINNATIETTKDSPKTDSEDKTDTTLCIQEVLIGKWEPLDGAKHPIEISRYGTVIQWWAEGHNSRYEYSLIENEIVIAHKHSKYKISKEEDQTYLEIFNNDEFSGKYIKHSNHFAPAGQLIAQENLKEEIVGKWQPVCGAKHPIEITKYGTIIQHWAKGHNSRFDYTLNGNQLDIRYNECKVEVVKNKSNTYLEIYNDNEFSGLYLKTK